MCKKISFVMLVLCLVLLHNRAIDVTFAEEEINQTQAASGSALTMQTATGSALGVAVISEESTDIASGTSYGMDWVIDAEGTLTITGVCDEIGSTRPEYGWQDYLEEIKKYIWMRR